MCVFVKALCMFLKIPSQKRELVSSTDLKEVELKKKGPYIHNLEISKHSMRGKSCLFHWMFAEEAQLGDEK